MPQLEMLQQKWEMDLTYWRKLTDEEFEVLRREQNEQLESRNIVEPTHCTCSDKGTKRSRMGRDSDDSLRQSKQAKTNPVVHKAK
jgi:hypothetical protein